MPGVDQFKSIKPSTLGMKTLGRGSVHASLYSYATELNPRLPGQRVIVLASVGVINSSF